MYGGAEKGFIEKFSSDYYFGKDGFGNMNFTDSKVTVQVDRTKHAALALIELANKTPGKFFFFNIKMRNYRDSFFVEIFQKQI